MAASALMPWPQHLFGCFGSKSVAAVAGPTPPRAILREDSANEQHSGSSSMRTSDETSDATSSDGPGARLAYSEPSPSPGIGPGFTRSASIQAQRLGGRGRIEPSDQHAASRRRSSRHGGSAQPGSPAARIPDDWHRLRRFAFVSDICCNAAAATVTKLMLNRKTEELVSIKFLDRRRGAVDSATQGEILNHRKLHSPHIARLNETFLTDNYMAVVTEHAPGGPLHRHVAQHGRLPEEEARKFFRQLLAGLAHCHGQGVYHRDLQLNAVRLDACGGVVLTDFGYSNAKLAGSGELADVRDRSASPAFTPPEVLLGHSIVNASYDGESLDVWAAGIILYVMVFGGFPFEDSSRSTPRSNHGIIKRLVRLQYRFPSAAGASEAVKDLLTKVFVKSREQRISLAEMAAHPWVTDHGALPPVATVTPPQGTPRQMKSPSADMLTGSHTPLGHAAGSVDFSQAPEVPAASVRAVSSGGGLFGAFRRDKSQSEADIAAVVKKALVRPS